MDVTRNEFLVSSCIFISRLCDAYVDYRLYAGLFQRNETLYFQVDDAIAGCGF